MPPSPARQYSRNTPTCPLCYLWLLNSASSTPATPLLTISSPHSTACTPSPSTGLDCFSAASPSHGINPTGLLTSPCQATSTNQCTSSSIPTPNTDKMPATPGRILSLAPKSSTRTILTTPPCSRQRPSALSRRSSGLSSNMQNR